LNECPVGDPDYSFISSRSSDNFFGYISQLSLFF